MRFSTEIGDKTVTLQCRDDLEPQANDILGLLKRTFTSQSERLKDGLKIQYDPTSSLPAANGRRTLLTDDRLGSSGALASGAMSPSAGCGHWSRRASFGQAVQLC